MASLSSYDKGKRRFEGRRYLKDIEAAHRGMRLLLSPMREFQERQKRNRKKVWAPQMHLTLGNHEFRCVRATEDDPMLDGTIGLEDLKYEEFGWTVHPFLRPVKIDGVLYVHYVTTGVMGRPATTASAILSKKHQTVVVGHQQGKQIAYATRADGTTITAIIAGSAYPWEEDYLGPQGNQHWRGVLVLNEVREGQFDECFISLNYLERKFGTSTNGVS